MCIHIHELILLTLLSLFLAPSSPCFPVTPFSGGNFFHFSKHPVEVPSASISQEMLDDFIGQVMSNVSAHIDTLEQVQ